MDARICVLTSLLAIGGCESQEDLVPIEATPAISCGIPERSRTVDEAVCLNEHGLNGTALEPISSFFPSFTACTREQANAILADIATQRRIDCANAGTPLSE